MPDIELLKDLQAMPLDMKVAHTKARIREWVSEYGIDGVFIAFSGGKDSTVLLHIARQMYPNIKAVFVDTGLEYPEIRQFVKTFDNVEILRPKMSFVDVIVLISNEFLDFIDSYDTEYFNINNLYSSNILRYCITNKDFNRLDLIKLSDYNYSNNISDRVGKYVCEFKGKPVTFSVAAETIDNSEFVYYVVLNPSIILKFLLYTLYNINKYYGNK